MATVIALTAISLVQVVRLQCDLLCTVEPTNPKTLFIVPPTAMRISVDRALTISTRLDISASEQLDFIQYTHSMSCKNLICGSNCVTLKDFQGGPTFHCCCMTTSSVLVLTKGAVRGNPIVRQLLSIRPISPHLSRLNGENCSHRHQCPEVLWTGLRPQSGGKPSGN